MVCQREERLGRRFCVSRQASLEAAPENAQVHGFVMKDVVERWCRVFVCRALSRGRRGSSCHFDFHTSQDPEKWQRRV